MPNGRNQAFAIAVGLTLSLFLASAGSHPLSAKARLSASAPVSLMDARSPEAGPRAASQREASQPAGSLYPFHPRLTPALVSGLPAEQASAEGPTPNGGWDGTRRPQIFPAVHHDTSMSLRRMVRIAGPSTRTADSSKEEREEEEERERAGRDSGPRAELPADAPALTAAPSTGAPMPTLSADFAGIPNVNGYVPPDPTGDIGVAQYVQSVNASFAVFDRAGNRILGPANNNSLWLDFGGPCERYNNGDPIVSYDQLADRWVISQFAIADEDQQMECVAVSTSGDATGTWYRYAFPYGSYMPDYPKLGIWPDGYYFTFVMFETGPTGGYAGAKTCAMDRARMLVGAAATQQCFDRADEGPLLPSDLDGHTPPPAGSPNYILGEASDPQVIDRLTMYRFHVDWATPAQSSFTGPISLVTQPYYRACLYVADQQCVPQRDSAIKLDALGARLMYRLAYRNMGTHESLVTNHTVSLTPTYGQTAQTGIGWYEIRSPGTSPTVYQDGIYSPDTTLYRWMGSAAMDSAGNMAMGYSVSARSTYPGIRYAGRLASDPVGTMPFGEGVVLAGTGSQRSIERWGDYTSMQVDPLDDCGFWLTNEYYRVSSTRNWETRISAFKFPNCQGSSATPAAPASITAIAGTDTVTVSVAPPTNTGNLPIVGYKFLASPGGATCQTIAGASPDPLTCTFTTLSRGTGYTFTATARNGLGSGPPVGPSAVVRLLEWPGAPSAVAAVASDSAAEITWSAAADNGSPITSYRATASPGGGSCQTPAGADPVPLTCTITGLANGTTYAITVTASNVAGAGPTSSPVSVTPAGRPGAPRFPTAQPGDTTATVSWQAASSNGSPVTSYKATASPGASSCVTSGDSFSCTIAGLVNGTTYSVSVTATNSVGTGPESEVTRVTPVAPAPPPPPPTPTPPPPPPPPTQTPPDTGTPTPQPATSTPAPEPTYPTVPPTMPPTSPPTVPATSNTPTPGRALSLTAKAVSKRTKVNVTVLSPCTTQFRFRLQKLVTGAEPWKTLPKWYRTATKTVKVGKKKVAIKALTVNPPKGTYRALVAGSCGYVDTLSVPVKIVR